MRSYASTGRGWSARNPGFGGAYRAGFEQARGEYVITLDADGSHDPVSRTCGRRGATAIGDRFRYVAGGAAEMPSTRARDGPHSEHHFAGASLPDRISQLMDYRGAILRESKVAGRCQNAAHHARVDGILGGAARDRSESDHHIAVAPRRPQVLKEPGVVRPVGVERMTYARACSKPAGRRHESREFWLTSLAPCLRTISCVASREPPSPR